jgi:hypothetical protein
MNRNMPVYSDDDDGVTDEQRKVLRNYGVMRSQTDAKNAWNKSAIDAYYHPERGLYLNRLLMEIVMTYVDELKLIWFCNGDYNFQFRHTYGQSLHSLLPMSLSNRCGIRMTQWYDTYDDCDDYDDDDDYDYEYEI